MAIVTNAGWAQRATKVISVLWPGKPVRFPSRSSRRRNAGQPPKRTTDETETLLERVPDPRHPPIIPVRFGRRPDGGGLDQAPRTRRHREAARGDWSSGHFEIHSMSPITDPRLNYGIDSPNGGR